MALSPQVGTKPKRLGKKSTAALLLIIVVVSSVALIAVTSNAPEAPSDTINPEPQLIGLEAKGYQFIKEVLAVDTTKYNVTVRTMNNPTMSTATAEQIAQAGSNTQYNLNSSTSTLQVTVTFKKGYITWANLYPYTGDILYTRQPSGSVVEAAQSFLNAYQEFSGHNVTDMLQILDGLNPLNGTTVNLGNLTLTVTHQDLTGTYFGDNYYFSWVNTYSGCDYKHLSITFQDGRFGGFIDNSLVYPIGDTAVKISRQEALTVGLEAAEIYAYEMPGGVWISDFNITGTEVLLNPQTRTDILYPCYTVNLYFNGTYPGSVHGLMVFVWADTGEIQSISKIAYCDPTDHT